MSLTCNGRWLLLLVAALSLPAQEPMSRPNVRATGEGIATAPPDQATLRIGVVSQAATARAAADLNARQLTKVLADLRTLLGESGQTRTSGYRLNPDQRYPREGGSPTITGYTATNTVEVRLDDLALLGKLIDTASQSGANSIQGVQFSLKNEQSLRTEAIRQAALQARQSAEAAVAALGLRVARVFAAEVNTPGSVQPVREVMMMARAPAAPTPIEPGTVEVRASVTVTLEVAP